MIKKVVLLYPVFLLLLGFLVSCSSPGSSEFTSPLSPPEWIWGEWEDNEGELNWVFTEDNAVFTRQGTPHDFKQVAEEGGQVSDSALGGSYKITVGPTLEPEIIFTFSQDSETTLIFWAAYSGIVPVPEELVKK
jgi:hypothetical protein